MSRSAEKCFVVRCPHPAYRSSNGVASPQLRTSTIHKLLPNSALSLAAATSRHSGSDCDGSCFVLSARSKTPLSSPTSPAFVFVPRLFLCFCDQCRSLAWRLRPVLVPRAFCVVFPLFVVFVLFFLINMEFLDY